MKPCCSESCKLCRVENQYVFWSKWFKYMNACTASWWPIHSLFCTPTSLDRLISHNNSHTGWVFGHQQSLQGATAHLSNGGSSAGVNACLNMTPLALQVWSFSPVSCSIFPFFNNLLITYFNAPEKVSTFHTNIWAKFKHKSLER